ncbi:MAG: FISUMP domain-containing protein [Bacteroidales bacterium]
MKTRTNKNAQNPKRTLRLGIEMLSIGILLSFAACNVGFAQNVGINQPNPDNSAVLDVTSTERGLLVPRMTTTERDAITTPANSLLIFNTTTQCYEGYNAPSSTWVAFGCIGCTVPSGVTATASPNPICVGSDLSLTGSATDATSWSWTGPNGFTSTLQNPTITSITSAGAGVYTVAASNNCGSVQASTATVTVNAPPTTATNSSTQTICSTGSATLSGNNPTVGTGAWTVTSGPSTLSSQFANTTVYNTTFTPAGGAGSYVVRWTISNSPCTPSSADATITVNAPPTTANAGSDINPPCDATTATLAGNTPTVGTGTWTVVSGTATITTPSSPTSGVTGLAVPGTATLRWTISNPPCADSYDDVVITTTSCCGPTFTDPRDAQVYNVALMPDGKCWFTENLNYGTYAAITTPQVSGTKFCQNLAGNNDPNCPMGGLYEWANLMQGAGTCNGTGAPPNDACATPVQGLCPAGWHIPSHYEWTTLEKNVGSNPAAFPYDETTTGWLGTDEGGNLKEAGITNWTTPNTGATNSSGFTALPGGDSWSGSFHDAGNGGYWWSSTESDATYAWRRYLYYSYATVNRGRNHKAYGFSVRCVKD